MEIKEFETQDIKNSKIPWVISDIHRNRKSGILHVMGSNKKFGRRIYIQKGELRFALSNQESDRLGRTLVEQGIITESQFTKTILKLDKKKRFGQYLLEQNLLDETRLNQVIKSQISNIIMSTFDLDSGLFFFEERELNLPPDLQHDFPFGPFMLEGIRNLRNLFLLYEELEEFQEQKIAMGKYPLVPVEKLPLNPQEAYAFSRVDGFSTLSQLEKISRMEKDPFSKLMLALLCLGVVEAERQKVLEFVNRFDKPEKLTSEALPTIALAHLTKQQTQDREKVIKKYLEIQSKTYWEFLEVGSKFTSEELRSTFIKLNKKFHPDTCNAEHLQDLRSHLNQIISHLNLAFNTLNDPNTRRTYIQKTNQKEPLDQHNLMNKEDRLKLAEETYKMGRKFMLQEELFNAYRYLEQAQRLSPNDSRILFDLAMVEMRNPKWQAKARAHLLKVIELAPTHGKAHFALAQIYIESNAKSQAVNHLKQAAEYDPANEEIFVLLEQLTQQGKGSFLDLFGKKKT